MSKFKLRTGVIGIGSMGQNHARIYSEISELVGVCDLDQEQGNLVSKRLGVKFFSDHLELLDNIDAVSIAVPTEFHHKIALDATNKGVHILVEKPISSTIDEAREIISASSKNNLVLAVGQIERHNPVIDYCKRALDSKEWGKLISISSTRVSNFPSRIRDVGVVMDFGIHDLDLMNYLVNQEVKDLYSVTNRFEHNKYEDMALIILKFSNGVICSSKVNWLTPLKVRKLVLNCTRSYVEIDLIKQEIKLSKGKRGGSEVSNLYISKEKVVEKTIQIEKEEPLKRELVDFLDCISKNKQPLATGIDGLKAIELALKASK